MHPCGSPTVLAMLPRLLHARKPRRPQITGSWVERMGRLRRSRPLRGPERFGSGNLDAETSKADIAVMCRCHQPDRGDAKVAKDLRTKTDLAPLPGPHF